MSSVLLGANGQLGQHLRREIPGLICCARSAADYERDRADTDRVTNLLERLSPEVIINAAAFTAVDDAEDHEAEAFCLNHDLPAALAGWSRSNSSLLVHYSTDYVFDGNPGRAWCEDDPVAPASAYGRTKLAGERAVASSGCRALVLRTAWVYSALPGNFVSAILRRAAGRQPLRVVADQIGSPTCAGTLAEATRVLLDCVDTVESPLLLHVAGRGQMSWHGLAELAVQLAAERGIIPDVVDVAPIASSQWPQKARRPEWSVLDTGRYERLTGDRLPDCAAALSDCLDQWSKIAC